MDPTSRATPARPLHEPQPLLIVGSVALDSLRGTFGEVVGELGGSALYAGLAAALIHPVVISAAVGNDAESQVRAVLEHRPVDRRYLTHVDHPSYRWRSLQQGSTNLDLGSEDAIYDWWDPQLPPEWDGIAFVGSMRPDLQLSVARQLAGCEVLGGDAMLSYIERAPGTVRLLVGSCNWFFCNQVEFELLASGSHPAAWRREQRLEVLCLKVGADGATIHSSEGVFHLAAPQSSPVVDTTGAGDALAGGMLACVARQGANDLGLALAYGIACASFAIEDIGLRGLLRADAGALEARVGQILA